MTAQTYAGASMTADPADLAADLRAEVIRLIRAHDAGKPRSRQVSVGPSELGHPCHRRLAYRALQLPPAPHPRDILPAWIGTAAHKTMEEALAGHPDWDAEIEALIPGYRIPAHVDAYHHPTGTVVDWKFVGDSSLRKHAAGPLDPQYRAQVHLYGYALRVTNNFPVKDVAVCFIPRNGPLTGVLWRSEPYDEQQVESALTRWQHILNLTAALGPRSLPLIPTAPANCAWCPWNDPYGDPADLTAGCPGHNPKPPSTPPEWRPTQGAA